MKTKLKFLKNFWERTVVTGVGATIGKIFYTTKNTTGTRKQYVFDLDNKTCKLQNISASPADVTLQPGAVVIRYTLAPSTDKNIYSVDNAGTTNDVKPTLSMSAQVVFDQHIAKSGTIIAANILTGVLRNGVAALAADVTMTEVSATGLSLNVATGEVTLDSATVGGLFTLSYKIADKIDHTVFVEGTVTVEVVDLTLVSEPMSLTTFAAADAANFVEFNILDNIKRNGVDVTIDDVTLVLNSTTAKGLLLDTNTGIVSVNPSNVTAGSKVLQYIVKYKLAAETITGNITVTIS